MKIQMNILSGVIGVFLGVVPCLAECPSMDQTGDCFVNMEDFAVLASQWLTGNRLPSDFVSIPGGTFQMGDSFGDGEWVERPVHTVTLDPFAIGKYEITNGQYCAFLNSAYPSRLKVLGGFVYASDDTANRFLYCDTSTASHESQIVFSNNTFSVRTKSGRDMSNDPVVWIIWYGAAAYCNWRSQQEGRETCYDLSTWTCDFRKKGYRLPTEAEWEYAARGGLSGRRFPWGDTISHSQANYYSESQISYDVSPTRGFNPTWNDRIAPFTAPVGSFPPNGFGLYDMTGNVWEWCNDWMAASFSYTPNPQTNPTGPSSGGSGNRILRGGGWGNALSGYSFSTCSVSGRTYVPPQGFSNLNNEFGFRVVLDFFGNPGGHWPLDGNYLADVPEYSGTPVGNPEFVTQARIGTWALDLDGEDAVVINGFNGILGTAARTCMAWIKTTGTVAPIVYWGDKDTVGGLWDLRVSSGGQLRVQMNGCGISGVTAVNTGQWVHVAAVLPEGGNNADDVLLYVNGVLETGTTVTAGAINTISAATMRIGANEAGNFFTGLIDDVWVYDRALTAEEIATLANPYWHWPLDGDYLSSVPEYSGMPVGDPVFVQEAKIGTGAMDLDGNDAVVINGFNGILGTAARTCTAWIKTTGTIGPIVYWGDKNTTGGLWDMRVNSLGQLRLAVNGGGVNGATPINMGQWVHVAVVLPEGGNNADDVLLYVNGVLETGGTVTAGGINTLAKATMRIGTNEAGNFFTGLIDDVRVYDRALTGEEIAALANP